MNSATDQNTKRSGCGPGCFLVVLAVVAIAWWFTLDDGRDWCAGLPARHMAVPLRLIQPADTVVESRKAARKWMSARGAGAVKTVRSAGRWNVATEAPNTPMQTWDHAPAGVSADSLVFLLAHARAGERAELVQREPSRAAPGGYACMYPVDVPVIAAGTRYRVRKGRVIVRVDEYHYRRKHVQRSHRNRRRTVYRWHTRQVHVPATVERFYVDQRGSIYHQPDAGPIPEPSSGIEWF